MLSTSAHFRHLAGAGIMLIGALLAPAAVQAGGGPENVCVVVNIRSWASLTVANHFIKLRQIPPSNVVYLDWGGSPNQTDIETLRRQILQPVFATLAMRKLTDHIDYVVYSSDFPWSIDAREEFKQLQLPMILEPVGSLTSMTFLSPHVLKHQPDFLRLNSNRYARPPEPKPSVAATHGFRNWYGWGTDGALLEAGGQGFILSTMLGVTSGRGNSVAEVVDYLTRSAAADGTRPTGTIYYMANDDIRTKPRQSQFAPAIAALAELGVKAEVLRGILPQGKDDVQGLMIGAATFDWPASRNTIRPGAICENLTSFAGDLREGAEQTPLTEFLRYGAAGSSGAVVEPTNLHVKFPAPQMHVHYARGCTLAEAFYQSVPGPYQLLIVGDPLCRPWAKIPQVSVEGLKAGETVSGSIAMLPKAEYPPSYANADIAVDRFTWFIDDSQVAVTYPGDKLTLNTARLLDGHHEVRVVGTDNTPIETQGRVILPFTVDNHHRSVTLTAESSNNPRWGQPLTLRIKAPGAFGCVVKQGPRLLGRVIGAEGTLTIDPRLLGLGPVSLQATAVGNGGTEALALSTPLQLDIESNEPLPGITLEPGANLQPGFLLGPEGSKGMVIKQAVSPETLSQAGVEPNRTYRLSGIFRVEKAGVYQLQFRCYGPERIELNGQELFAAAEGDGSLQYLPLALAAGYHRLVVRGKTDAERRITVAFGTRGVQTVSGIWLQHIATPDANSK